jgi:membrane protein DedA with SNARE-associated domain
MADDAPPIDAPAVRRPSRRALTLIAVPLVAMVIAGYVGDALAPTLVDRHPAWLIALNARNRNLVLATNYLDAWTYYSIGIVRLLLSDPLFFLLGYWYGDAAVQWMERRTKTWGQMLRQLEQWFGKAAYPLVFVAPNNAICLFAGAAGMPLRAFFAVNLAGTVVRLWLIRRFGEAAEGPLDDVVGWVGDNRAVLLVASIGLVLLSIALEAKSGETEVTALARLDDELEEELDEAEATSAGPASDRPAPPGAEGAREAGGSDGRGPAGSIDRPGGAEPAQGAGSDGR